MRQDKYKSQPARDPQGILAMSLNDKSTLESPAPPRPAGSLSARAMAGVVRPSATAINPRLVTRGVVSGNRLNLKGNLAFPLTALPQSAPSPKVSGQGLTPKMEAFSRLWFFDWLTLTIPNGLTGTGEKRRSTPAQRAEAMRLEGPARSEAISRLDGEDRHGVREETDAVENLCLFAVVQGLRPQRIGRGSDGYNGGLSYGKIPQMGTGYCRSGRATKPTCRGLRFPAVTGLVRGLLRTP